MRGGRIRCTAVPTRPFRDAANRGPPVLALCLAVFEDEVGEGVVDPVVGEETWLPSTEEGEG
jgi:hypothetical protein